MDGYGNSQQNQHQQNQMNSSQQQQMNAQQQQQMSSSQQLLGISGNGFLQQSTSLPINIQMGQSFSTFTPLMDETNSKKRKIKNEDGTYTEIPYSPNSLISSNSGLDNSSSYLMTTFQQQLQDQQQQIAAQFNSSVNSPSFTLNSSQNNNNNSLLNTNNNNNNNNLLQPMQQQQQTTTTTTTTNNNNQMNTSQNNTNIPTQLTSSSLYPIPSISITTTQSNYSPRNISPNPSPNHSPSHSPLHSPHLPSDNYLMIGSENENSDPPSPMTNFAENPPFTWTDYKSEPWYTTFNTNGEEMPVPLLNIMASKGFSYINGQWIYCRRNHFQLDITAVYPKLYQETQYAHNGVTLSTSSSSVDPTQTPSYMMIDGIKTPINGLTLTIKGIKNRTEMNQPESEVELFQTNSKREKQGEHAPKPVAIQFGSLVSVQRLHFRKATLNNARRNGQPNPHQEFNQLVVSLYGRCMGQEYCIVSYVSPALIVRTAISSPSVSPAPTDLSPVHTPDHTIGNNNHHNNTANGGFNSFGSNLSAFPDFSTMRLQSPGHSPISPRPQLQINNNNIATNNNNNLNLNNNNNNNNNASTSPLLSNNSNSILNNRNNTIKQSCLWNAGEMDKTIVYHGKVGINVDSPTFALSVQGTIYASEGVFHPSDIRIKHDLKAIDTKDNLDNVNKMKLYDYKYNPQWSYMNGRDPYLDNCDRGVIAQDIQKIIPLAVRTIGNKNVNGQEIENLLVIKNEALVMETIGATQQLSKEMDELKLKLFTYESKLEDLKQKSRNQMTIMIIFMVIMLISAFFMYRPSSHHRRH